MKDVFVYLSSILSLLWSDFTFTLEDFFAGAGQSAKELCLSAPQAKPHFSYDFFSLNAEQQLQPLQPQWKKKASSVALVYDYRPQLNGLSIDKHSGELNFDSLANFAAADAQCIDITVTKDSGDTEKIRLALQIQALNKEELQQLVELFINDEGIGPEGQYNAINTSKVKDMSTLFFDGQEDNGDIFEFFNGDISKWDVSRVRNMKGMFFDTRVFNRDIGSWETSRVRDMSFMFNFANSFNQDISAWDTSKVRDMKVMFGGASSFNQKIGDWDTSRVEDMSHMLRGIKSFNQDIGNWDTSRVKSMRSMFNTTESFDQDIGGWDTSKVEDMAYMFREALVFNQDIGDWDTSRVVNMNSMFEQARAFNQDIGTWDTSKVVNMASMLSGASVFNQDIGAWDTAKVRDMSYMFKEATAFNQDISAWDVSQVQGNDGIMGVFVGAFQRMFLDATAFNHQNSEGNETCAGDYFKILKDNGGQGCLVPLLEFKYPSDETS